MITMLKGLAVYATVAFIGHACAADTAQNIITSNNLILRCPTSPQNTKSLSFTDSEGALIHYRFDRQGACQAVEFSDDNGFASSLVKTAQGWSRTLSSGAVYHYRQDAKGRIASEEKSGDPDAKTLYYQYDNDNRVLGSKTKRDKVHSVYNYDARGRISVIEYYLDTSVRDITVYNLGLYSYDDAGHRKQVIQSSNAIISDGGDITNGRVKLHHLKLTFNVPIKVDANGNWLGYKTLTVKERQLLKALFEETPSAVNYDIEYW